MNDNNDEHTLVDHVQQDASLPWQIAEPKRESLATEQSSSTVGEEVPLGVESDIQHLHLESQPKAD